MAGEAYPTTLRQLTTDSEWESIAHLWASDGVDDVPGGGSLAATLDNTARTVTLAPGGAYVRGFFRPAQSAAESVAIPNASSQDRIDRCVLQLDRNAATAADKVKPVIVQGTPSSAPVAPPVQQTGSGVWQIELCSYRARSNGAVDALVDERKYVGAMPVPCLSTARPGHRVGRLIYESDTGRMQVSTGTAWVLVHDDSGWVNLAPRTNWSVDGGSGYRVRRRNDIVTVKGALQRTGADLTSLPALIAVIPAGFRPSQTVRWSNAAHYETTPTAVYLSCDSDGNLNLIGTDSPIKVTNLVAVDGSWMLG